MKNKLETLIKKFVNKETIAYLFFGVVATILNIVLFYVFVTVLEMPTGAGNLLDTIICVLFQYVTNRLWVFQSKNTGKAAWIEFGQFVGARAITAVIDQIIVVVGADMLVPMLLPDSLQDLGGIGVKVVSNVIVIILNYIFSKLIVFKKKDENIKREGEI